MSYIRKITKIKDFIASCVLWNMANKRTEEVPLYFIDGIIGVNSGESVMIGVNEPSLYGFNIGQYEALRKTYALKDKDVFIGRDKNYILFRDGSQVIGTDLISVTCNEVDITANKITFNGVELTVVANKLLINGKEIAVVGGDINTGTNKITGSGQ